MTELTRAIMAAGAELETEHGWTVGDDGGSEATEGCQFVTVLTKHLTPLINSKAFTAARIAELRAEADELERGLK